MRRRLAAIATGVALLIGLSGTLSPANSAILCPPGCLAVGSIKILGNGFPNPTTISMSGSITALVSTRTGGVAGALDVNKAYFVNIYGTVTPGAAGTVKGFASFYASTDYFNGEYDSVYTTVKVEGTPTALRISNSKIDIALVSAAGGLQGTAVLY